MAGPTPDRHTIQEYMMHPVARAFDTGVPDLNPPASVAAFPSECVRTVRRWLLIDHAVDYHA